MGVTGTQEEVRRLPAIVRDRDYSSPNIPRGKGGNKSKEVIVS